MNWLGMETTLWERSDSGRRELLGRNVGPETFGLLSCATRHQITEQRDAILQWLTDKSEGGGADLDSITYCPGDCLPSR